MGLTGDDLWDELSDTADAFAALGRRWLAASRDFHSPGLLPEPSLVADLDSLRLRFRSLVGRIVEHARSLGLPIPPARRLATLKDLAGLLDAVSTAEERALAGNGPPEPAETMPPPSARTAPDPNVVLQLFRPEDIGTLVDGEVFAASNPAAFPAAGSVPFRRERPSFPAVPARWGGPWASSRP